jgi:hypothetical protein
MALSACYQPLILLLILALGETSSLRCRAGTFDFDPTPITPTTPHLTRVGLADFPSTGSSWTKRLLDEVAREHGLPVPGCAMYPEGTRLLGHPESLFCHCGDSCEQLPSSALVKTHFPAQSQTGFIGTAGQYQTAMTWHKLVVLQRHPVPTLRSNVKRWGGGTSAVTLNCWWAWWKRVAEALPSDKVHYLKYEKLCEDTVGELYKLLQFLGNEYASISRERVQKIFDEKDLGCIHAHEIWDSNNPRSERENNWMRDTKDLTRDWGYNTSLPFTRGGSGGANLRGG